MDQRRQRVGIVDRFTVDRSNDRVFGQAGFARGRIGIDKRHEDTGHVTAWQAGLFANEGCQEIGDDAQFRSAAC